MRAANTNETESPRWVSRGDARTSLVSGRSRSAGRAWWCLVRSLRFVATLHRKSSDADRREADRRLLANLGIDHERDWAVIHERDVHEFAESPGGHRPP